MPQATDNKGSPVRRSEAAPLEAYYKQPELWTLERYEASADERLRARMVAAMVDPQAETVLDVGCGNGFVTRRLRARRSRRASPQARRAMARSRSRSSQESRMYRQNQAIACTEVYEACTRRC